MIVNVVGVKKVEGTSKKTGKPFDAYIIAYNREAKILGYNGMSAGEIFCDVSLLAGHVPIPGDTLMVDRNSSGFVESIEILG